MDLNLDKALNAVKAARAEAKAESKTITIRETTFTLPQIEDLGWDFGDVVADAMTPPARVRPLIAAVLNGQMEEFDALKLTKAEFDRILGDIFEFLVGVDLPESLASSGS